jgi:hypothetical protein
VESTKTNLVRSRAKIAQADGFNKIRNNPFASSVLLASMLVNQAILVRATHARAANIKISPAKPNAKTAHWGGIDSMFWEIQLQLNAMNAQREDSWRQNGPTQVTAGSVHKEGFDLEPLEVYRRPSNSMIRMVHSVSTAPVVFHNNKKENHFACHACPEK